MNHLDMDPALLNSIRSCLLEGGVAPFADKLLPIALRIQEEVLNRYVERLIRQVETILDIDPLLSEEEILENLARNVAGFVGADFANIHIYNRRREERDDLSYSPPAVQDIPQTFPMQKEIADEALGSRRSLFVPDIGREPRFRNRERAEELGIRSFLAVPIFLPSFSSGEEDLQGILQIFYKKQDHTLSPVDTQIAEMLSRRIGYVIARKRIYSLQKINLTRDKILDHIYLRLARREGIKMKEVFNSVIPELADIMKIQRCTLFSVLENRDSVMLEAGFPEAEHGIGKIFPINEPYIYALTNQTGPFGDYENEKIHPSYILINNPQKSELLPAHLRHYMAVQRIHCVLYIPLHVDGIVQYFLAFDAQAQHQRFAEEEIMMFTFLGKELMKGLRLEKMDDLLHDFKNPAIAIAGFARRVQRMLEEAPGVPQREKIDQAVSIIASESLRIQALALTLHGEGKESVLDLNETLRRRVLINREAAAELGQKGIRHTEQESGIPLWIRCYPLHIERVLDNLLNNAAQASAQGGEVSIRCYQKTSWAIAEITNAGEMPEEEIARYLSGEGRGRGLHITTRLIKHIGGRMTVECEEGKTTVRLELPLVNPPSSG